MHLTPHWIPLVASLGQIEGDALRSLRQVIQRQPGRQRIGTIHRGFPCVAWFLQLGGRNHLVETIGNAIAGEKHIVHSNQANLRQTL